MKIPKEKLCQFGLSIKMNRKEQLRKSNSARWTQKMFCDGICSQNSLISMEKGNAGRFIDNYVLLAERLGMRLAYEPDIDKKIETYTKHLYKAVEFYDLSTIEKYVKKAKALLEDVKDCLWYADVLLAITALEQHYLHQNYLLREYRDMYADMIGEFSEAWDDLLKSMVFYSAFIDVETDEFEHRFKKFEIDVNKGAFNKVNVLLYHYEKENITKFNDFYKQLEKEWMKNKNYARLLDLYNLVLLVMSFLDIGEVSKFEKKMRQLINDIDVTKLKLMESYYNLGIAYHNLRQYDKTLELMNQSYCNDENRIKPSFIYIAHAQRKLGEEVLIPFYSDSELAEFSKDTREIYTYYSTVNDLPEKESEKILMNNVLPSLSPKDSVIINILKDELEYLVDKTNHYKNLRVFDKRAKELLSHNR